MSDLERLTCPSCGSSALEEIAGGYIACQHCQSQFISKKGKLTQRWWEEEGGAKKIKASGECPICGKVLPSDQSFRCKRCHRPFICQTHQNPATFLCTDCQTELAQQAEQEKQEQQRQEMGQRTKKRRSRARGLAALFSILILGLVAALAYRLNYAQYIFRDDRSNTLSNTNLLNDPAKVSNSLLSDPQYEDCVSWQSVGQSNEWQELCVYGIVIAIQGNDAYATGNTYFHFSQNTSENSPDFRVASFDQYYPGIEVGDCVAVSGTVRSYGARSFVYIDPESKRYPGEITVWKDAEMCQ